MATWDCSQRCRVNYAPYTPPDYGGHCSLLADRQGGGAVRWGCPRDGGTFGSRRLAPSSRHLTRRAGRASRDSLSRLEGLPASVVVVGHGRPFSSKAPPPRRSPALGRAPDRLGQRDGQLLLKSTRAVALRSAGAGAVCGAARDRPPSRRTIWMAATVGIATARRRSRGVAAGENGQDRHDRVHLQ